MAILNYSLSDITNRIILNLPSRFIKDESSNVYKLFQAIAEGFSLNTTGIDELFGQTSLAHASGGYVDDYISQLSGLGRYRDGTVYVGSDETDDQYKTRYKNTIYVYNATKPGIRQVVIDMVGNPPVDMYTANKRGAYPNARYYYNDGVSVYGAAGNDPFKGYIEFSRKPNPYIINELLVTIRKCKAFGVTIYLKYPQEDDLSIVFGDGVYERVILV